MGAHPKKPSTSGKAHFVAEQRIRACLSYQIAHKSIRKVSVDAVHVRSGKRGFTDPVWTRAFELFEAGKPSKSKAVRQASRRQFKDLVSRWYTRWDNGELCERVGQTGCVLTQAEIQHAVQVIGTPVKVGNSFVHFESMQQALDSDQGKEIRDILSVNKMSTNTLHHLLVNQLKLLSHKTADRRPKLPPGTLASRRQAAEVWAGRVPWLYVTNCTRSEADVPEYFDWEYYFNFTFMIDACSFEDGPGSGVTKSKFVYGIPGKLWGPELEEPEQSIVNSSKLMYYTVIHPQGGVICGPDLVYTGSKVPVSRSDDKAKILTDWCVCYALKWLYMMHNM